MHYISVKNWLHHMHLPQRRDSVVNINHLVHSEGFWALVAITMILATLFLLAWWGNVSTISPLPDYRLIL
ncbi:MAG: hypothetical protein FVQ82_02780 [Planctomycetes bacterium]|nr:hypothetical protein [Planctomycetota bacterium]